MRCTRRLFHRAVCLLQASAISTSATSHIPRLRKDVEIPSQGDVILTPRIRPAPLVHLLTNLNALAEILNLDAGGDDSGTTIPHLEDG
jgi:hypothetical protein